MNLILFEEDELDHPLSSADPRSKHIRKVLRLGPGDHVQVGVVEGRRGTAVITRMEADGVSFHFDLSEESDPLLPLTLLVGHPRPIVIRRLLKDLSTLGVRRIVFAGTDLGERSYQETRLWEDEGYRSALVEGAAQARSTRLPEVLRFAGIRTSLEALYSGSGSGSGVNRLLLDAGRELPAFDGLDFPHAETCLAVGSERGWSERERHLFADAGFTALRAGMRTLRTETACIVGCTLALSRMRLL